MTEAALVEQDETARFAKRPKRGANFHPLAPQRGFESAPHLSRISLVANKIQRWQAILHNAAKSWCK
jgi:hypothetical protein